MFRKSKEKQFSFEKCQRPYKERTSAANVSRDIDIFGTRTVPLVTELYNY